MIEILGIGVSTIEVSVGMKLFVCQGRLGSCMIQLIPNASPPRMTRLITASSNTPDGVTRIVHPTRGRRERDGRGEPDVSNCLVIIDVYVYFTRCKKCAQVRLFLLLKPCYVNIE